VYIADINNERIRKVDSNGIISTIAGRSHFGGDGGPATAALLSYSDGTVAGSDGSTYFTDTGNNRVRKIGSDGTISTIAGTGDRGFFGDGGSAAHALLYEPTSLAIDTSGNLYVVDQGEYVRKITPAGIITTVAGNGNFWPPSNDSGSALSSGFELLMGIAVDAAGNLYLSEYLNCKIKKVSPSGDLTTYAGTGQCNFAGDGQVAASASFRYPGTLALDGSGNLYVSGAYGDGGRIRKIAAGGGTVSTIAGNGTFGYGGDGGRATSAQVSAIGLAADSNGGLWMTDYLGVRYIGRDGIINHIAGGTTNGFAGDDATASSATLYASASAITLNSSGEVIIADGANHRIRKLQPNSPVRMDIVSGNNQNGTTGTALNPFVVKVTGQTSVPPAGVSVTFAVTAGAATLSANTAVTDASGQCGVTATPTKSGTLTVTATAGTFTAVFTATVKDQVAPPPADAPVISPGGIGQNGFSVPPVQTISTGAITTIYGSNFMAAGSAFQVNSISGGVLSTNFAGICVTFGGVKAPIFGVAVTQITVAVPTIAPGTVAVQVLRNCGAANELKSNVLNATAQAASPEFLYVVANADGVNPVAAVGSDGGFIGTNGATAKAGDILVIYALGLGATDPAQTDGVPAAGAASVTLPVGITIGGVGLAATDILYAGASPSYIGLYQVNMRVPSGVASGKQSIVMTVGTNQSPTFGYLTMQ
jgi:uncharacterized protein (TIGR03437 family)